MIPSGPTVLELASACTTLGRVASREMAGACPFCGGSDRFHVLTEADRWFCRQCHPRRGDAIDFVQARDGIGFHAACHLLGIDTWALGAWRATRPAPQPREEIEPSRAWRAAAEEVLTKATAVLARVGTPRFIAERGFTPDTVRRAGFGLWTSSAECSGLYVPNPSVVIPWRIDGDLWALKARLLAPRPDGTRYLPVTWADKARRERDPAGQPHLFGADHLPDHDAAVLVEGELDAVLLEQEAGDLAACVTLGSCAADLPARAACRLLRVRRRILAYDTDDAGRKGAARLANQWPGLRLERVSLPAGFGKDPGEFHLAGGDLRAWVRSLLLRGA